jgi:rhamnosyl/mannosyltransferase
MKIVHIYKDYFPVLGGIENHLRLVAEAQAKRGHQVTVLVTSKTNKHEAEAINGVLIIKAPRQFNVQSAPISIDFPSMTRMATINADIAHLHAPYPVGEASNLWFGRARKTIITWHSDIVRQQTLLKLYAPVLRRVIARANRIIPTSEKYMRTSPWLTEAYAKCRPVPYGIDIARFQNDTAQMLQAAADFRQQVLAHVPTLNSRTALVLLCVGQLRYYKAFGDLIRALPSLPNCVMAVAGTGNMREVWETMAHELGVANRVVFLGETSPEKLPGYYHGADIFVLPSNSRAEAFGIVNIEAMACGLPLVTTEVGSATSWVNVDGETGLVVPPQDPAALASAIQKLQDPQLRKHMGAAGRLRAQTEFTQEKMLDRIEQVYADALSH